VRISKVDADAQNIFELSHSIDALKAAGRRTSELEAAWWHKLSGPLSAVLMPLLGAVAAFGLARSGQLLIRAVIGMALGFRLFRGRQRRAGHGQFRRLPALIAAWAPFLLFAWWERRC
jgi:lipopolysaccharide export system permease protein